jgi:ferritin
MNRKLSQLSPEIGDLLTKQLAHELKNFVLYNGFANYFSLEGIVDLQEYYTKRAEEEKHHHDWILGYLHDADFRAIYSVIEQNKEQTVDSWITPFTATVTREIETTQMLYAIYELAISQKDFMTASWLYEKLIKEQIEEESISRMAVSMMEIEGDIYLKAEKILELLN